MVSSQRIPIALLMVTVPAFLCLIVPAWAQSEEYPGTIRWKAAKFSSAAAAETNPGVVLGQKKERHIVVQLNKIPRASERKVLVPAGITLLRYVGNNAFFAKVIGGKEAAAQAAGVVSAFEIETDWKLHPMLLQGEFPPYSRFPAPAVAGQLAEQSKKAEDKIETLALYVIFHPDVALDTEGAAAIKRHGGLVRSTMRSINGAVIWVPLANMTALAQEDVVQWLEPPLPPLEVVNNSNRAITQADIVQAAPYGLDGTGINVLVYDGGTALASHVDFGGRLTVRDSTAVHYHPTHVAGTIGGDGSASSGLYRGMAPNVLMQSYGFEDDGTGTFLYTNPGDIESDYDEAINTYGADISNNSIGTNLARNGFPCEWEGDYGATAMLIDAIVGGSLGAPMRIVWANGNERGNGRCGTAFHTTAPPACAKNHITVGALNSNDDSMTSFSSWGPTDDGRIKPDVSAPGCQSGGDNGVTSTWDDGGYDTICGTSMASPTVCGLSALILQDFKAQYPGEPLPRNSTLKILLAHNVVDLGNTGPDYKFGYGSVRVKDTIDFMRGGSFLEDSIDQGDDKLFLVDILPGTLFLKATLAWDDPPGAINTIPELVNDLDIVAISPGGAVTHYPWTLDPNDPDNPAVRTQSDRANNIEQVVVDNPEPGIWVIRVRGYSVPSGPQVFSVATTPEMQMCSSTGVVLLDAQTYSCSATAEVTVIDCDLNTDPGAVETTIINVNSTTRPAGKNVLLSETTPNSAKFVGTLDLSETNAPGVLKVSHGDIVTATYNDANDGSGSGAVVQDTATVDCVAPVISNVSASATGSTTAVVTFDTDETTCGTAFYGLSCGSLIETAIGSCGQTSHSIILTGLDPNTTYFYAVEAEDDAGNLSADSNDGSCYTFTTPVQPDYFTELFDGGDNDLDNMTVTFIPNGSSDFYIACTEAATAFPTDPTGGTTLSLIDDDCELVTLSGGAEVWLYGINYPSFWVGSNGYLTLTDCDTTWAESLSGHFSLPRISAFFDDFNPSVGGSVSWKQLGEWVAVTWENVPEYGTSNSNSFQVEMFFDGTIRLTWLAIAATDGITGLSKGLGLPPDFAESDLSGYGPCGPRPPIAQDGYVETNIDTPLAVNLLANDDGLPDPPGELTYSILSLPSDGNLSDPCAGAITSVPYVLADGGNIVTYTPDTGYAGPDSFTFDANDSGTPPDGGASNVATVSITVIDCRPPAPTNPDPCDGANDVPPDTVLTWNGAVSNNLLFAIRDAFDGTYVIDIDTGAATLIGPSGVTGSTYGLSHSGGTVLYGSKPFGLTVIQTDGSGVNILGSQGIEGMAYDPQTGTLFGAINGSFFTLDPATGAIATTLPSWPDDAEGLAFVPSVGSQGSVYGTDDDGELHRYDVALGTFTLIGNTGLGNASDNSGLAYAPELDVLFHITRTAGDLYRIDKDTAVATFVANTGITGISGFSGLAYGPDANTVTTARRSGWMPTVRTGPAVSSDGQLLPRSTSNSVVRRKKSEDSPISFPSNGVAQGLYDGGLSTRAGGKEQRVSSYGFVSTPSGQIVNGDFETGDFSGWTLLDSGYGTFVINDGTYDPTSPDGPLAPYSGNFSAVTDQDGYGTHTIYQDVTLAGSATSLHWADMIRNHASEFSHPNQEFRVEIWNTSNQVLVTLFSTNPGDPLLNNWTTRSVDISQFAGMTIRVAFTEEDDLFYFNVHLDDIRIELEEVTYDVYFGTEDPPTALIASDLNEPMYDPGPLQCNTTYYWQVVAKNSCGQTYGPIWSFTTAAVIADFDHDCDTDDFDLRFFVLHWLDSPCGPPDDWCLGTDLTESGNVDFFDFAEYGLHYQDCIGPGCD